MEAQKGCGGGGRVGRGGLGTSDLSRGCAAGAGGQLELGAWLTSSVTCLADSSGTGPAGASTRASASSPLHICTDMPQVSQGCNIIADMSLGSRAQHAYRTLWCTHSVQRLMWPPPQPASLRCLAMV